MAVELVCSCGQRVRCDAAPSVDQSQCPACGALLSITADPGPRGNAIETPPAAARKRLWALMEKANSASTGPPTPDALPTNQPAGTPPVRKGLWGVMQS